jgi:hypothetical protein
MGGKSIFLHIGGDDDYANRGLAFGNTPTQTETGNTQYPKCTARRWKRSVPVQHNAPNLQTPA